MASTARGAVAPLMGPSAALVGVGEQTGRIVLTNYEQVVIDTTRSLIEGGQTFHQVLVSNATTKAGNDIRADHGPALAMVDAESCRDGFVSEQTHHLCETSRENAAANTAQSFVRGPCVSQLQVGTTLTKAGNDVRADHGGVAFLPFDLSRFGVGAIIGDLVAPTFGGLTGLVVSSASSVTASWAAGSDTTTSPANLTYEVHVSTSVLQAFAVRGTVKGSTSFVITDLLPGQTYYVRARCRDEAGNINANAGAEISVTPDLAPTFAGASGVTALSVSSVRVSWSAAADDHDLHASITYKVSVAGAPGAPFVAGYEVVGATHLDIFGLGAGAHYFKVRAFDTSGIGDTNSVEVSIALTPDPGDPPVLGNILPIVGTPIAKDQAVTFDVTDTGNMRRIIVTVTQSDTGVAEVVHDGDGFRGYYAVLAGRTAIAGGWHYSVRRSGGWTGAPTFRVYAFDVTGNENA